MKTIIFLLATSAFVAGATSVMATEFQGSEEAQDYELSHRVMGYGAVPNTTVPAQRAIDFGGRP
jgi:hypothetical protein